MSDDLLTWLRAQLDEDERVALAIRDDRYGDNEGVSWKRWSIERRDDESWPHLPALGVDLALSYADNVITPQRGEHIARWDPARVLAEIDAKRRILDEIVGDANGLDMSVDLDRRVGTRDLSTEPYLGDELLRILALPYADRPGYREEWRP